MARYSVHRLKATSESSRTLSVVVKGLLILVVVVLSGCTASWRAPLETRGHSQQRISHTITRYRVKNGDSLTSIAWRADLDWRSLAAWNGLRQPYTLIPGQVLRLRAPRQVATKSRPPPRRPPVAPATKKKSKPVVTRPKAKTPTAPTRTLTWGWPARGKLVSRFAGGDTNKKGIKIAGTPGQAVLAAESGRVVYSGSGLTGYGGLIIIKHNDNYLSAYGHNRKLLVQEGDRVTKGKRIAEMGQVPDGRAVLHFEIRRDGNPVDPLRLMQRGR